MNTRQFEILQKIHHFLNKIVQYNNIGITLDQLDLIPPKQRSNYMLQISRKLYAFGIDVAKIGKKYYVTSKSARLLNIQLPPRDVRVDVNDDDNLHNFGDRFDVKELPLRDLEWVNPNPTYYSAESFLNSIQFHNNNQSEFDRMIESLGL